MNKKTKYLTTIAVLSALAFVVMVVGRIPIVLFLKYDPKDIIITIGGFILGPMAAFFISLFVSIIEMFSVSDTGIIGAVMNVLSTCTFACTAAYIYKKNHTIYGAVVGLAAGLVLMTGAMMLWNFFVTPLYMDLPRQAIVDLLLPAFLPFNLLKGGINATVTLIVYKPLVRALRSANLLPKKDVSNSAKRSTIGITIIAGLILVSCILLILIMQGVI